MNCVIGTRAGMNKVWEQEKLKVSPGGLGQRKMLEHALESPHPMQALSSGWHIGHTKVVLCLHI
jgi:hypothetical protein